MPTDLPPDYKPAKPGDVTPGEGKAPGLVPSPQGEDLKGGRPSGPNAGTDGRPGATGDVVDPPGWKTTPGSDPIGVPTPAGTPTF
jgi:hypothetical protein